MESKGEAPSRFSISTGRLTERFSTNSFNKASARPSASPPPASPKASLFRFLVTIIGGEGLCTALIFGILEGSRASSIRAFSRVPWKYL